MRVIPTKRCVGESPPNYGARCAYSFVTPDFRGQCCLHYELNGIQAIVGFTTYQQALTAATMAIFSIDDNFQQVTIKASEETRGYPVFPSAKAWLAHHSRTVDTALRA